MALRDGEPCGKVGSPCKRFLRALILLFTSVCKLWVRIRSHIVGRGKMSRKNMPISPLLTPNVEGLQFEPPTTPMSLSQAIEQHRPPIQELRQQPVLYRF